MPGNQPTKETNDPSTLQNLVDHAGMLVLQLDPDGRIQWFNSVFQRLSGLTLDNAKGKDWVEMFIPGDHRDEARKLCRGHLGKRNGETHTKPFRSVTGAIHHVEWFHSDLTDHAGNPTGILCIGRDVTELHSARISLAESQERNRAILETAVNAIVIIGEDRLIESVNSATQRLFGYTREELIGQNVSILMPEPYAAAHDSYVENYKISGQKKIIGIGREAIARRKDGTLFPIDLSIGEIRLPSGRRSFTGIIRDITARKQLEEKILRISEEEQQRIGRDIHDDLCQQLAAISCLARVIQQRLIKSQHPASTEQAEIIQMLTTANQRAREMARGLMPVVLDSAGLPAALAALAHSTQRVYSTTTTFTSHIGDTTTDSSIAVQIYRIAQEAIANAVKHAEATLIQITLQQQHSNLVLRIEDNGSGIPDHSPSEGTGIGLLTMKRRAHMVGGDLTIETHPQTGTTVTCSIPMIPAQATHQRPQPEGC